MEGRSFNRGEGRESQASGARPKRARGSRETESPHRVGFEDLEANNSVTARPPSLPSRCLRETDLARTRRSAPRHLHVVGKKNDPSYHCTRNVGAKKLPTLRWRPNGVPHPASTPPLQRPQHPPYSWAPPTAHLPEARKEVLDPLVQEAGAVVVGLDQEVGAVDVSALHPLARLNEIPAVGWGVVQQGTCGLFSVRFEALVRRLFRCVRVLVGHRSWRLYAGVDAGAGAGIVAFTQEVEV